MHMKELGWAALRMGGGGRNTAWCRGRKWGREVLPAAASTAPRLNLFIILSLRWNIATGGNVKRTSSRLLCFESGTFQFEVLNQGAVPRHPSWRFHTDHECEPSHSSPNRLQS
jgi:hypothetical protein